MDTTRSIEVLATRLHAHARITALSGAGVSAASGVPTFRATDGLWRRFRPEDLATPQAFARDPRLVWEWYDWRRQRIASCRPNAAHERLAGWSRRYPGFILVTQNVDGLHERAGTKNIVRFHGSIWDVRCSARCAASPARWRLDTTPLDELPPPCPYCGTPLRPDVVWFGEPIEPDVLDRSAQAAACDVFFMIGTSAVVYPAAALIHDARRHGALIVELNPDTTPFSGDVDIRLSGLAEMVLPEIDAALERLQRDHKVRPLGG